MLALQQNKNKTHTFVFVFVSCSFHDSFDLILNAMVNFKKMQEHVWILPNLLLKVFCEVNAINAKTRRTRDNDP